MSSEVRVSHSEMLAKRILDQYFGQFRKIDNVRPDWLERLEIDRFYPTLGLAIEFQGDQHYRVVPGMHAGPEDFQKQVTLDSKKIGLVEKQGYKLFSINLYDLDRFRVRNLFKTMAEQGREYASNKGLREEVSKIDRIRWDVEPDERLMRRTDRLGKMKKNYFTRAKKSWWKRLLGK
ncbi:MAG: hypothetical protein WD187_01800 [Candidatus Woykebacteria bacterium]